jgi:manganese transport protein
MAPSVPPPAPPPDPSAEAPAISPAPEPGWRRARPSPSLAESYRSVEVSGVGWFRKLLAFAGPGYLVAVGYMDPGNWATDLAGGSRFGYTLLSVILISNLMAVLLQGLASKLGIVTGRDLAQACRDHYSRPVGLLLWVAAELAIAATDLAEVVGTAIALNLLFGLPLPWGIVLTVLDVFLVLLLQNRGFRRLEAVVIALVAIVGLCFLFELIVSRPDLGAVARGFVPDPDIVRDREKLYLAIGILGATVMPHNLYLHSSIVQTRKYALTAEGRREAVRYAFADSTIALTFACSSTRPSSSSRRPPSTPPATRRWPRSRTPTSCSRRCSAWGWRAPCSPSPCWPAGRTRRSPARSPGRSSWRASSTSGCGRGCAASSRARSPSCRRPSSRCSTARAARRGCSCSAR